MYCKVESQRLMYQRNNQRQLRAELYQGVWDIIAGDQPLPNVDTQRQQQTPEQAIVRKNQESSSTGRRVILAPSYVGTSSDRYMRAQYQDAMAIVRAFGKPDLFITITCKPKWSEITQLLLPGQHASERPDLTARVFHAKKNAILDDLNKGALGVEVAKVYVIEFQKRGLLHAHLLLILGDDDKPQTPDDYDKFVSAEIPDPANEQLYHTVMRCMMQGPCGSFNQQSPCMKDGVCSKRYPKSFRDQTHATENGYPGYRRRDNGRTVIVKRVALDNRHVVPYNPWLLHKYDCHFNVEVCTSITGVKYLYKYIFKGNDRAAVSLGQEVDEIQMFLDVRYISASESCWRIMRFEVQAKSHVVVTLPIHLQNQQSVLFRPDGSGETILARARNTELTCFFELATHDEFAKTLLYHEVPTHFRFAKPIAGQRQPWHSRTGSQWIRRTRHDKLLIGRMVYCPMTDMERYCLRLLLCYRKGPTSYLDLPTVRGTVCPTYQQAAVQEGLQQDDNVWDRTLREAASFQMPWQLRYCFAMILTAGQPKNPRLLWDTFADHFSEDFHRQLRDNYTADATDDHNRLLRDIEHFRAVSEIDRFLRSATPAKDLTCIPGMPQLADYVHVQPHLIDGDGGNPLIRSERQYSVTDLDRTLRKVHQLNEDQRTVMPIANEAELISETVLIVWDEASMASRYALEAVDRTLQDIIGVQRPFGGKVVLLSGDFRQILPIVPKRTESHIIDQCIKRSVLWPHFNKLQLQINLRVRSAPDANRASDLQQFADFLLQIGEGRHETFPGLNPSLAKIPVDIVSPRTDQLQDDLHALITRVYTELERFYRHSHYFTDRSILSPLNADVTTINNVVLDRIPEPLMEYRSVDTLVNPEEQENLQLPPEFLNSLNISGIPVHRLRLKRFVSVLLLRNLNTEMGLCNGTRLQIIDMKANCIHARILTGKRLGDDVLLPRIYCDTNDKGLPF
ncbi:uncharacterized protein LOC131285214 [Anopheles ziemanni]|uniref:uncharacterized protein LOC131264873 n=1 Tax=Anopheles coustani TaxID=139045 RepID=UPI00265B172B|nr:uncharacterized protein LOC131264873 [Anopheles coustani]XP_058170057.1 uncharacterized protein LOC131285214 [Anopheles ziemanni]